jgi:hypothetical protein
MSRGISTCTHGISSMIFHHENHETLHCASVICKSEDHDREYTVSVLLNQIGDVDQLYASSSETTDISVNVFQYQEVVNVLFWVSISIYRLYASLILFVYG